MTATLCALVHGEPGVGKSWFGQTTPAPRLVLDAEGGSRFAKRVLADGSRVRPKTITWNPRRDEPPVLGDWETCAVSVQDFDTMVRAFEWLDSGKHQFKSVVVDSLTEVQKRCKDAIAGAETPSERDWGLLLIRMEHLVRNMRDLVFRDDNPLEAVLLLALTTDRSGTRKPAVQGALGVSLPGYVDVEGYLFVHVADDGTEARRMLVSPRPGFEAKDRTDTLSAHYGPAITNPNVEEMLRVLDPKGA